MKILHTSDWHLGQVFYGYDRREEQQAFLEALAEVVGRERPDVMIVSGDVFHNSTPSAQADPDDLQAILAAGFGDGVTFQEVRE